LFDEPLSNLDALLRDQVRTEIHRLHAELGFGAVFVTHDHSEAFAPGDRLAIMKSGKIEQLATPQEVFDSPVSEYVADFIGMSNRLELHRTGLEWTTAAGTELPLRFDTDGREAVAARLWPDDITLHRRTEDVSDCEIV